MISKKEKGVNNSGPESSPRPHYSQAGACYTRGPKGCGGPPGSAHPNAEAAKPAQASTAVGRTLELVTAPQERVVEQLSVTRWWPLDDVVFTMSTSGDEGTCPTR
jgi:hypothetical protein